MDEIDVCNDKEQGLSCVACCCSNSLMSLGFDEYKKLLEKQIGKNTEVFRGKTIEEKIALAKETLVGAENVCKNLVYLTDENTEAGCVIHPSIVGREERPCEIDTSYCGLYFKVNKNEESQARHLAKTKGMSWAQYSARNRKEGEPTSLSMAYVRSMIREYGYSGAIKKHASFILSDIKDTINERDPLGIIKKVLNQVSRRI
ncbi:hypothetical protein ACFLZ7_00640 [Nanoarchaeota archaeon]